MMLTKTEDGGRRLLKLLVLAILVAAGGWALYANLRPGRPAMDMDMRPTSGSPVFPVTAVPVERGPITGTVVYTGSVLPFNEEDIYPRVAGRIVEIPVYPGDPIRRGQVLTRLDSVELSSRVKEAEAGLAAAQANRAQMEKELAAVAAESGYARATADRTERLFVTGLVSRQDFERDRAMATAGEARLDATRARLESAVSMLAQSEAGLGTVAIVRDYVNIVASNPGYVVKRFVAPGVLVQPGTAILKIAQIDSVRLQANVGEKDVASIRVGTPVQVRTAAADQAPVTVRVSSVFPFVDQGSRTAVVEALADNTARRFLPGQYVTMQFVVGERAEALTVPASAVGRMGGTATVWLLKDGHAEPRAVATGLQNAERVEVVEGLMRDERVVVQGREGLYAGARIREISDQGTPKGGSHAGH
jgi:RND family efflux transporter MFP subunit